MDGKPRLISLLLVLTWETGRKEIGSSPPELGRAIGNAFLSQRRRLSSGAPIGLLRIPMKAASHSD